MENVVVESKPKISPGEMERRRETLHHADANNRLSGIYRGAADNDIFEDYIRGKIDVLDIIPQLKARHGLK